MLGSIGFNYLKQKGVSSSHLSESGPFNPIHNDDPSGIMASCKKYLKIALAAGIAGGSTLFSGIFKSATLNNFGFTLASFTNTLDVGLLTYFGLRTSPPANRQGTLFIGFIPGPNTVYSGNVSSVPVPAAMWLFGAGLIGLGIVRRKT